MIFEALTEKGKIAISTPDKWKKYLSGFPDGTKMTIEIDRKKNARSLSQNAFMWLYLGVIETETGNEANDLHELFKRKFLPPVYKKILGTEIKLPASTTDLSKYDFSLYMEKICAETGVPIPDPELAGFTSNHQTAKAPDKLPTPYPEDYKEPLL
jgi:hypothetical protein